jgi:hypothetical protein
LIKGDNDFSALFESVFPILKAEWESSVNAGDVLLDEVRGFGLIWLLLFLISSLSGEK